MFIATLHYRKGSYETEGRKAFVGVFATETEAEGWVKAAFYGHYKNGSVYTDGGAKLHLTNVHNAFHVRGSLDLPRHENGGDEAGQPLGTCFFCHRRSALETMQDLDGDGTRLRCSACFA